MTRLYRIPAIWKKTYMRCAYMYINKGDNSHWQNRSDPNIHSSISRSQKQEPTYIYLKNVALLLEEHSTYAWRTYYFSLFMAVFAEILERLGQTPLAKVIFWQQLWKGMLINFLNYHFLDWILQLCFLHFWTHPRGCVYWYRPIPSGRWRRLHGLHGRVTSLDRLILYPCETLINTQSTCTFVRSKRKLSLCNLIRQYAVTPVTGVSQVSS